MGDSWPIGYNPIFDPDIKLDPFKDNREGLKAELKESIDFSQSEIGTLTRIKERSGEDPETQELCRSLIEEELSIIKLTWEKINELCA